jgi:eukaryotic-like serine/threonine-protein kinase
MSASKIGRFEIISEIAHSAQSSVYRATDTATNRPVALKAFNLDLAGDDRPQLVQRLILEAESTRNLTHQNIVLLYGAGEIDGRFCVATEYVEGFSVAGNIAKGERYTVWDLLDISRQVCNGLDHAHSHGVVHRRLHPANILVQWDGTVKILGFGIAGMWSEEDSPGVLSPASYYASPEQVRGQSLHTRSNLFSWGAILYEMATGKKPFDGADVDAVRLQILEATPVPPSELNPKVPAPLNALILKALSKVPTERFATGRELLTALEACKEAPKQAATLKAAKTVAPTIPTPISTPAPAKAPAAPSASPFAAKLERTSNGETSDDDSFDDEMLLLDASGKEAAAKPAPLKASAAASAQPAVRASAAPAPAAPKFNVDPMMAAESAAASASRTSFADSELPPLKAQPVEQFLPSPPPEPVASESAPSVTVFNNLKAPQKEKKKFDLPEIDTKLLIYGLVGGLAIVLLVAVLIAMYVRVHTTDDEGTIPPPAATQQATQPADAPAPPAATSAPADQPAAMVPAAEEPVEAPVAAAPVPVKAGREAGKRGREAATPVAALGQLSVDSVPQGASIQVDGRFDSSWVTPYTVIGLNAGSHNIVVTKAGYSTESRALSVVSGKNALSVRLSPLTAMVSVSSDPAGANILVDGRDSGRVTPAQINLEKGAHSVLLRKSGYLDESMSVDPQPGQTIGFAPHLRQLGSTDEIRSVSKIKKLFGGKDAAQTGMGTVAIRTNPKGAQISVNQRLLDHVTPAEFLLNPGNYLVDITASGYKPLRRVITVEKDGKVAMDENLDKQ